MVTINEVAKRCGVSIATVSHVINKTRYVRPALVERVERAIAELEYVPLRASRRQRLSGTRVVGIFLSSIRGSYASDLVDCLSAELTAEPVRIVTIVSPRVISRQNFLEYQKLYHLDIAIIHYSVELTCGGQAGTPIPTVFINHAPAAHPKSCCINFDYPRAVGLTLRHLINRGHTDIAFLACQSSTFVNRSILAAAHEVYQRYGMTYDERLFWSIGELFSRDELVDQIGGLFRTHPEVTAVITAETGATMHIIDYIRLNNLSFPQDISLITIGDMYIAKVFFPNITRVDMKVRELVACIQEQILGGVTEGVRLIPADFIPGESAGSLARGPSGTLAGRPEQLELNDLEIEELRRRECSACISLDDEGALFSSLLAQGVRDCFGSLGIQVLGTANARLNAEMQAVQLGSLAAMQPDVLVCLPVRGGGALAESCREITKGGVRLVFAADLPEGMLPGSYASCVAGNELETGRGAGKLLAGWLLRNNRTCAGFLCSGARSFCARQRDLAAVSIITEEFPELEITARADFISAGGAGAAVRELLSQHPQTEGIYLCDARAVAETAAVLRELGREEIGIVAAGLDVGIARLIAAEHPLIGVSSSKPYEMGRAAALACARVLLGKQPPEHIALEPAEITAKNLEKAWLETVRRRPSQER